MASRPPEDRPSEEQAHQRWLVIQLMRIGGFAFVLLGILMTQGVLDFAGDSNWLVGTIFVLIGLVDGFFMPVFLARKWRNSSPMKRFYKAVSTEQCDGGWRVSLDGRPLRTQGGAAQVVPTRELAEALAAEWDAQGEEIDPKAFVLRDLTDYAIDRIAADPAATAERLLPYGDTDTLLYRADPDELLYRRQQTLWEPVVTAAEARHGVRFERVSGIVHRHQPAETKEALAAHLATLDPFALAALETMTTIATSLLTGLAALEPGADLDALFAAANAEEDWQAELWGWDIPAEARRAVAARSVPQGGRARPAGQWLTTRRSPPSACACAAPAGTSLAPARRNRPRNTRPSPTGCASTILNPTSMAAVR